MQSETDVDLSVIRSADDDGGIPHGQALIAFVDAALTVDPSMTGDAREALIEAAGEAATVDAAAVTAMFQLNTRAADAAGIPVEERGLEQRNQVGSVLGFEGRSDGRAP